MRSIPGSPWSPRTDSCSRTPNSLDAESCTARAFPSPTIARPCCSSSWRSNPVAPRSRLPVYSHLSYDIVPDERIVVSRPDILIIEGLNVLQPARPRTDGTTGLAVSDFFDFSVYVDAEAADIRRLVRQPLSLAARHGVPGPPLLLHPVRRSRRPTPPSSRRKPSGTPSTGRIWLPTSCPPAAGPRPSCARIPITGSNGCGSARCEWGGVTPGSREPEAMDPSAAIIPGEICAACITARTDHSYPSSPLTRGPAPLRTGPVRCGADSRNDNVVAGLCEPAVGGGSRRSRGPDLGEIRSDIGGSSSQGTRTGH